MIVRNLRSEIQTLLGEFPAVGLLGARQVGKTTLALQIAEQRGQPFLYLDLESPADAFKLTEPETFFDAHKDQLLILDEVQRMPGLFPILRGVIDRRRKEGHRTAQFLLLGSASPDVLRQTSESLAGRIAYTYLGGLTADEVAAQNSTEKLWLRGGFPDSFLAPSDAASLRWRNAFITTYLEKDIPQIGPKIPAIALRRLWTMLAHQQSGILNYAGLAGSLGIAAPTAKRYVELLEDLFLIKTLPPWSGNIGKRLTRAPKCYVRDSGIAHALLSIRDMNSLLGHPVVGGSWEGFVIENILPALPAAVTATYFRTSGGAEIDLVLEGPYGETWAVEIKRSLSPHPAKGFYIGCEDLKATRRLLVYPGREKVALKDGVEVLSVIDAVREIKVFF